MSEGSIEGSGREVSQRVSPSDATRSYLGLLFATDSAALLFFLIVKQGGTLPAKLPFTLGPHLPFKAQVVGLSVCLAAILTVRLIELFPEVRPRFEHSERWIAAAIFLTSVFLIGLGGWKLLADPSLIMGK